MSLLELTSIPRGGLSPQVRPNGCLWEACQSSESPSSFSGLLIEVQGEWQRQRPCLPVPKALSFAAMITACTELSPSGGQPSCHSSINVCAGPVMLSVRSSAPTMTKWEHLEKGRAGLG